MGPSLAASERYAAEAQRLALERAGAAEHCSQAEVLPVAETL
ncbi:MAG: hypothetical protein U9Q70_05620 [Chloroflexota bacterium]|nr:hypothetical protein [Chloroflexota bacterium]